MASDTRDDSLSYSLSYRGQTRTFEMLRRNHICTPKCARVAKVASAACIGVVVLAVLAISVFIAVRTSGDSPRFSCSSDLTLGPVRKASSKGLCLDDTTFSVCPSMIPSSWPNTNEHISSLRLFAPWKAEWPWSMQERAWDELKYYVETNDVKILLGVEITCNESADAVMWEWSKRLLRKLGAKRLLGFAVGNELDLLWTKEPIFRPPGCMQRLWNQNGFLNTFFSRIQELDKLVPGFKDVPVMSVWSTYCFAGEPFVDNDNAKCLTFFREATRRYGKRVVFTFNIYPYFDTGNHLDPGTDDKCTQAISRNVCFESSCFTNNLGSVARDRMQSLLEQEKKDPNDYQLWVGESGWSFPVSSTTQPEMKNCKEWSSREVFQKNYAGWLSWDLSLQNGKKPADHAFYFTMRDAQNFGQEEHFGLIEQCGSQRCKLDRSVALGSSNSSAISV